MVELKKKNEELSHELEQAREDAAENEAQPKRGKKAGPSVSSLQREVSALKAQIERLEKVRRQ